MFSALITEGLFVSIESIEIHGQMNSVGGLLKRWGERYEVRAEGSKVKM